jgi:hypothetical protein
MFRTQLLQWSEPAGARLLLVRLSGGLRRLFISDLFVEGLPIVLFMCAIWAFALTAGANVMPFWKALIWSFVLAVTVAFAHAGLFLLSSKVSITTTHFYVGARGWRNRSIQSWIWETHPISGSRFHVLVLKTKRSEFIRVALPSQVSQQSVERALSEAGIGAMAQR